MTNRSDALIQRIEENLTNEGFKKKPIYQRKEFGFGDFESFFDLMVDVRLGGKEYLTAEEVWENMKMQVNFLLGTLAGASDDYIKLQNRYKNLEEHVKWLESLQNSNRVKSEE